MLERKFHVVPALIYDMSYWQTKKGENNECKFIGFRLE
jgi:hypothetical protein